MMLAVCLALAQSDPVADPPPIPVMSFNIRYGLANDGENRWEMRRESTFAVIRNQRPAILGLQEALRFQIDEIRERFPNYAEVGLGRNDGGDDGEYCAILFDRSRFRRLADGNFWYSDTPAIPGSVGWGNRLTRIATWVLLFDSKSGRPLTVFNTHWDHESQPSREKSANYLVQRVGDLKPPTPVIVMGDLNAGEENPGVRRLKASGLRDTFRERHPDAAVVGTFHGFRGTREGDKIDYVFVNSDFDVVDASIVYDSPHDRLPSDHFPITATLRYRG